MALSTGVGRTMRISICLLFFVLLVEFAPAIKVPGIKIPVQDKQDWSNAKSIQGFSIGAGIYDITGPVGEVGMMGYAMMNQISHGIQARLRARAFIFEAPSRLNSNVQNRVVFVSTDSCMIFHGVKQKVVERLQALYGSLYTYDNVLLSGTHTHSGPAGYSYYLLYDTVSRGFQKENFEVIVNGIVAAIQMAHNNMSKGGRILINTGELLDSNINRSPTAYQMNPDSEKAKYKYDVDKIMTLLRFEDENGKELGTVNWFAVHGTSMYNTNLLVSPDNKGYASYSFERLKNGNTTLPGFGKFVAAFAQTNEGDVSPNTKGAFCPDGTPCGNTIHSICNGYTQGCNGIGPGNTDFESMKIIGSNQFKKALDLYNSATKELPPTVDYIHQWINFQNISVDGNWTSNGKPAKTCKAALGDGFAGGTTDGPGDFDFHQGTNSSSVNPYWNFIASFISDPTPEDKACQAPKPILLNIGGFQFPAQWAADILPVQIFRLGDLVILGLPAEFTTMSGRRIRESVLKTMQEIGAADNNTVVVIAGLSNDYSHYVATFEEYAQQRYEAASTIYGPHTLAAYQQEASKLVTAMSKGTPVPPGPLPADISGKTITIPFILDFDVHPIDTPFGSIQQDVKSSYKVGETVSVVFWGANPRNNYRTQDTFLTVEKYVGGTWKVILTDGNFDAQMKWSRNYLQESSITIVWQIDPSTEPGTYRIQTFGTAKDIIGDLTPYTGTSSSFTVVA